MAKYILSDPNFSDGTYSEVIEKIVDQFRGRPGVKLIGYEPDPDFDRLPAELLGRPEAMREALLDAAGAAYELIDMEKQRGRHPRIGAVDTIEFTQPKTSPSKNVANLQKTLARNCLSGTPSPSISPGRMPVVRKMKASPSSARATTRDLKKPSSRIRIGSDLGRRNCIQELGRQ